MRYPQRRRSRPLGPRVSEQTIQATILQYLRFRKVLAWKNPTTGVYDPTTKRFRRSAGPVGAADIFGVMPGGQFLGVEVKRPGQSPKPHQLAWIQSVVDQGGIAFTAHSMEEAQKMLEPFFVSGGHGTV